MDSDTAAVYLYYRHYVVLPLHLFFTFILFILLNASGAYRFYLVLVCAFFKK